MGGSKNIREKLQRLSEVNCLVRENQQLFIKTVMACDKINLFRRIEGAIRGKNIKRLVEPSIPHQVRHGK